MTDFIPQIEPWIDTSELNQFERIIESTYVVEHALTDEFEQAIIRLTGSRYAMAVTNGTAALFCCLKALNIGPGDEVIVPDLTFVATSNSVIMAGAIPVFCDVDPNTLCIDVSAVESLITKRTKAIMPVHLYGNSADMESILDLGRHHNIKIIEDAAQGVGVKHKSRHVGTTGDCSMLSFYGNKTITCGQGGVILTDSEEIYRKCGILKNHGRLQRGTFVHHEIGYNFAFTEMQAAVGISQLQKLDRIICKKKKIRETYKEHLGGMFEFMEFDAETSPVHWFTSIYTDKKEALSKHLADANIGSRSFFYPLHLQPCYLNNQNLVKMSGDYKNSTNAYSRGLSLPSAYGLTESQQMRVIEEIRRFHDG
jgi:perosamine synthetase